MTLVARSSEHAAKEETDLAFAPEMGLMETD